MYNDNDVIRELCLELSQITGFINKSDENKNENKNKHKNKNTIAMSLQVKDEKLLKSYNKYGRKLKS